MGGWASDSARELIERAVRARTHHVTFSESLAQATQPRNANTAAFEAHPHTNTNTVAEPQAPKRPTPVETLRYPTLRSPTTSPPSCPPPVDTDNIKAGQWPGWSLAQVPSTTY